MAHDRHVFQPLVRHVFQPLVSLTKREDGRYDVEIDWAESYLYAVDDSAEEPHEEPLAEADNPQEAGRAQMALEHFTGKAPEKFIISYPPAGEDA